MNLKYLADEYNKLTNYIYSFGIDTDIHPPINGWGSLDNTHCITNINVRYSRGFQDSPLFFFMPKALLTAICFMAVAGRCLCLVSEFI